MAQHPESNIVWHGGTVTHADRCNLLKQHPTTLWLTGLSASGKSTLAFALERNLIDHGHACYVLDGDNIRHGLNRDLGFSEKDRSENIRRIAEVAKLMNDAGLIVITAFISPFRVDRIAAKNIIGEGQFREIHISTPLDICESRDPKGLYRKARSGALAQFTGISSPYEAPIDPAIAIDTSLLSIDEAVKQILKTIALKK